MELTLRKNGLINDKIRNVRYYDVFLDETVIGHIYYVNSTDVTENTGNIGYYIYEKYRRKGYAYKSCLLLFDMLKKEGIESLKAFVEKDNEASKRVIRKLRGRKTGQNERYFIYTIKI